ncbi:Hypothetical predicted protein [Paramuricea clavata]|uniref:Uncharacterized protein n=1 Tax=Paramuricea clavata TaxID=317549 RepID=A0A7D9IEW1_PARCT|nr:Hypothetical predicted protein [Paramuricea clavata]
MKCIGYTADINANENLRKIITRLPDHMIERWKVFLADIREKVLAKASVPERLELAKKARLCFSCLNRGYSKNDCRSKKKCEKSDSCPYFHHPLLHSSPPPVASILDKPSMMPVIRARFRAPNGRAIKSSRSKPTRLRKLFSTCLKDIEFNHVSGSIDLILGVHYTHLHSEEEIRRGEECQPVAKKTKLGWYVIGVNEEKRSPELCSIYFVRKIDMERFYQFETLGVQAVNYPCPKSALSLDEKRAMELMERSCKLDDNRYVIGLPWNRDKNLLPDNRSLAETRLRSLEKSLSKNDQKAKMYDQALMQYAENNWAIPLSEEDLKVDRKPVYYLPHHGVYRPDKKSPGLIGNLLRVLLRFREEQVAFSGDISKMFLQILLPEEDTHVHRFLWRNLDAAREPTTYTLQRVMIGDKPSPDMESFLSFEKANESEQPKEADGSESDPHPVTPIVNLDGKEENKTLSVIWNPTRYVIGFASKEVKVERLTKRSVLSNISKLYDPLGLASAVKIKAKIALQNIWKAKQFDWDDPLPEVMSNTWKKLFTEIESLKKVEFPRCLQPNEVSGPSELDVFADASKDAYGAVAYLVWTTPHGFHVSLVSVNARVAPLRHTAIPRLELMAALSHLDSLTPLLKNPS